MRKSHIILIVIVVAVVTIFLAATFDLAWTEFFNWGIFTAGLAVLICIAVFFEFEEAATTSKEIALVAMLGTASAVLRVPFAAVPGVQPCTYLIICSGYVFGPTSGFVVGTMTPLVSNFFLGHGPWTLYQMVAWGFAGLTSGYLHRIRVNRLFLIILGIAWGYLYGVISNLWFWSAFIYPHTLNTFVVTQVNSVWFDTLHAAGNAVFLGFLGMKTIAVLNRFKERFSLTIVREGP